MKKIKSFNIKEINQIIVSYCFSNYIKDIDYIVAIANGGLEIGKMFAQKLQKPMFIVDYSSYKGRGNNKGQHDEAFPTIKSKKILIVDDIVDSGHTMEDVIDYYWNDCVVKSFVLYFNKDNECNLNLKDVIGHKILYEETKPWIVFPWEKEWKLPLN